MKMLLALVLTLSGAEASARQASDADAELARIRAGQAQPALTQAREVAAENRAMLARMRAEGRQSLVTALKVQELVASGDCAGARHQASLAGDTELSDQVKANCTR